MDRHAEAGVARLLDERAQGAVGVGPSLFGRGPAMSMPTIPRGAERIAFSTMISFWRSVNVRLLRGRCARMRAWIREAALDDVLAL